MTTQTQAVKSQLLDDDNFDVIHQWPNRPLPLADNRQLEAALNESNVETMLMVYVHFTRDESMLDRFAPHVRQTYMPSEFPAELVAELRAKLRDVLTRPGAARTDTPPVELMQKMMSVGVGEPVADEFVPLMFDQIGFDLPPPRKTNSKRPLPPQNFRVLVIGAGLTGLAAAIKLGEAGYNYVIVEKNPDVGGTWYENRYPGVGVDTPSHFYCYSFEQNPEWSSFYPKGREMFDYLHRVAEKYDLRRHVRFETKVTKLVFDERNNVWNVTLRNKNGDEEMYVANAVINAHGPVNRWQWPKIPGFEDFKGPRMHTAGWDPDVNLKGKRVAIIGTGASSAQLVPAIAKEAGKVVVLQRSKHWVINNPHINDSVSPAQKWAFRHIPKFLEWFRFRVYWGASDGLFVNVVKDPNWPADSPAVSQHNDAMRQWSLGYLHQKFADRPDLIAKLTPDFPVFSKRIILDNGWFDSLLRDNVELEVRAIERVLPNGIQLKDGTVHEVDVIACATGFNVSKMIGDLTIIGRSGRSLGDEWGEDDPRAYMGLTVPGYPNYFLTTGPNSAPNHAAGQNFISETQINFIIESLDIVVAHGAAAIDTRHEAYEAWNKQVDERMKDMIWTHPKAHSYYNNSKGRVFLSCPYRLLDYWSWTRKPKLEHFQLLK